MSWFRVETAGHRRQHPNGRNEWMGNWQGIGFVQPIRKLQTLAGIGTATK